jgi:hypothetical protein
LTEQIRSQRKHLERRGARADAPPKKLPLCNRPTASLARLPRWPVFRLAADQASGNESATCTIGLAERLSRTGRRCGPALCPLSGEATSALCAIRASRGLPASCLLWTSSERVVRRAVDDCIRETSGPVPILNGAVETRLERASAERLGRRSHLARSIRTASALPPSRRRRHAVGHADVMAQAGVGSSGLLVSAPHSRGIGSCVNAPKTTREATNVENANAGGTGSAGSGGCFARGPDG